jgi:hypothetical protein
MEATQRNPLRSLIRWAVFIFIFLLLAYVALFAWAFQDPLAERRPADAALLATVAGIGAYAWRFAEPLLQLMVVLLIVDWLLGRLGIEVKAGLRGFDWNVQAIIAITVIGSFALAALGGITQGVGVLKDLALVVVGFYFGTQRKMVEVDAQTGKLRQFEEHQNPVSPPPGQPRQAAAPAPEDSAGA